MSDPLLGMIMLGLIVVVIIFLFLGSFRSVIIPVIAIPVSLIGGVFLMQAFGFTVNLLTLLAIVLSVGLVVDDAIVVVENVERAATGRLCHWLGDLDLGESGRGREDCPVAGRHPHGFRMGQRAHRQER